MSQNLELFHFIYTSLVISKSCLSFEKTRNNLLRHKYRYDNCLTKLPTVIDGNN